MLYLLKIPVIIQESRIVTNFLKKETQLDQLLLIEANFINITLVDDRTSRELVRLPKQNKKVIIIFSVFPLSCTH